MRNKNYGHYLILMDEIPVKYIGPFKDIEEVRTLNRKMWNRGRVMSHQSRFGPLKASQIINPQDFKKGFIS